jgi:hypothetical protein
MVRDLVDPMKTFQIGDHIKMIAQGRLGECVFSTPRTKIKINQDSDDHPGHVVFTVENYYEGIGWTPEAIFFGVKPDVSE